MYLQLLTAVTQTLAILAAFHGLGNHINVVLEKGEGHNFLKFAWLTMLFFIIAIAVGKCAVAAFLLEINGTACMYSSTFLHTKNGTKFLNSDDV